MGWSLLPWNWFNEEKARVSETPDEDPREDDGPVEVETEHKSVEREDVARADFERYVDVLHFDDGPLVVEYDQKNKRGSEIQYRSFSSIERPTVGVYGDLVFADPEFSDEVTNVGGGTYRHRETAGSFAVEVEVPFTVQYSYERVTNFDEIDDTYKRDTGLFRTQSTDRGEGEIHPFVKHLGSGTVYSPHSDIQTKHDNGDVVLKPSYKVTDYESDVEPEPQGTVFDVLDEYAVTVSDTSDVSFALAGGNIVVPESNAVAELTSVDRND